METGLAGKVVVITGAARGIGLECARQFSAEGAKLVLGDLDGDAVRQVAREVFGLGIEVDVANQASADALVREAVVRHGGVDVLVTCAGVFHSTPLLEITGEEWDRILAVNLRGVLHVAQATMRSMIARGGGRIITIGSLSAQSGGLAAGAAYAASKGGVEALTKSIARAGAPHGITANCIHPGIVDTAITQAWKRDVLAQTIAATPLARMARADEVAMLAVVLASERASFMTGSHVDVNGGLYMA